MQVERFPPEYYEKIAETPVTLYPFDPESKQAALAYGAKLNRVLEPLGVKAELFGSTELEISGKGEWEFALFLTDAQWYPVLTQLINHFKSILVLDDFTPFGDRTGGFDIEISAMRGAVALRNQAIMRYWQENAKACAVYEAGKLEHAYSRRAYYRWKDELIAESLKKLQSSRERDGLADSARHPKIAPLPNRKKHQSNETVAHLSVWRHERVKTKGHVC